VGSKRAGRAAKFWWTVASCTGRSCVLRAGESYIAVLDAHNDVRDNSKLVVCRQEGGAANMAEAHGKLTGTAQTNPDFIAAPKPMGSAPSRSKRRMISQQRSRVCSARKAAP
jgi:hypothetical protein